MHQLKKTTRTYAHLSDNESELLPSGQLVEATHFVPCWKVPEIHEHMKIVNKNKHLVSIDEKTHMKILIRSKI